MYRIESEPFLVQDAGVDFVVRVATDYAAQALRQPKGRPGNPFANPSRALRGRRIDCHTRCSKSIT